MPNISDITRAFGKVLSEYNVVYDFALFPTEGDVTKTPEVLIWPVSSTREDGEIELEIVHSLLLLLHVPSTRGAGQQALGMVDNIQDSIENGENEFLSIGLDRDSVQWQETTFTTTETGVATYNLSYDVRTPNRRR